LSRHIVIIAGEESGDQHAAHLLKKIQAIDHTVRISGFGGKHLESLGMHSIFDLTSLSITGATAVLFHVFSIYKAFKLMKKHLLNQKPDLVILVDYPGFNLRMAKWIKKHIHCPVLYYISPQIWAWKAKRIDTIKRCVDHMAVILPFELSIYAKENIPHSYVGHPLNESLSNIPPKNTCRKHFSWNEDQIILAILPGSRKGELKSLMPVIVESLNRLNRNDLKVVIPVAKSLNKHLFTPYLKQLNTHVELIDGQAPWVIQAANAVVVASGTASLESALLGKPSCIIYKSSWFNYYLATRWMNVNYLGLSNLLLNQMVFPELLQTDCNAHELSQMITSLLVESSWKSNMLRRLDNLHALMHADIDKPLEHTVFELLK
jgi:lipid-A-disaccharide synthase